MYKCFDCNKIVDKNDKVCPYCGSDDLRSYEDFYDENPYDEDYEVEESEEEE